MKPIENFERIKEWSELLPTTWISEVYKITGEHGSDECKGTPIHTIITDGDFSYLQINILWEVNKILIYNMETTTSDTYKIDSKDIQSPKSFALKLIDVLCEVINRNKLQPISNYLQ